MIHTTELGESQSLFALTDPDRTVINEEGEIERARVSSHYVVTPDKVYQLVDDGDEAWHAREANSHTIGVEVVGEAADPRTWSEEVVERLSALVAWLSSEYGIPLEYRATHEEPEQARGFVAHAALDPTRRTDPGMWFPWPEVRAQALRIQSGAGAPPSDAAAIIGLLIVALGLAWALK